MLTGLKIFTSIVNSAFAVNFVENATTPQMPSCSDYDLPLFKIPVSNRHLFPDINISQGSVATRV